VTDDDLRRLASLVVDELLGRLVSRPANDTRPKVVRRSHVARPENVTDAEIERARQGLRRRGHVVR
jgi:hypothetical protein